MGHPTPRITCVGALVALLVGMAGQAEAADNGPLRIVFISYANPQKVVQDIGPIKAYLENSRTLSGDARLAEPGLVQVSEGDFTKLSLITGLRVSGPLWLEASLESVLSGENVSAGHSWGLGISYSY